MKLVRRRRWALLGAAFVVLAALVWDLGRSPGRQWSTRGMLGAIDLYQATLSRLFDRAGVRCRFVPTCSHYGEEVIARFGAARGTWLAGRRIVRCGPWTPLGTQDPPPER